MVGLTAEGSLHIARVLCHLSLVAC